MTMQDQAPQARLPVTALILCGGKSSRMGRPKAFLPFAGQTIVEHLVAMCRELFNEVFLVANEPEKYSHLTVDVVKDVLPHRGPLGGILSGLLVATNSHAFVIACDMPLVQPRLLKRMAEARDGNDVLVLSHDGFIEPLLGLYSKECIKPLEESLFGGRLKTQDFLLGLNATTFEYRREKGEALPSYYNVNTPQDYCDVLTKSARAGNASLDSSVINLSPSR